MNARLLHFFSVVLTALLLSWSLAACGDKPQTLLASAKDYLAKNDNKAAVIQIKNALQGAPDWSEARYLLGTTLLDSGDPVGAETELRKALALKYPQDLVIPPLAKALLAQGKVKQLTQELAGAELQQPAAKASLQMSLASVYAMQGQREQSQAALDAALAVLPDYAPAVLAKARQKAAQGDVQGAMALVDEVLARTPGSHEAWILKGNLLAYAEKQHDQALVAYRKALAIKPDLEAAHAAIVVLLLRQSQLADAAAQIEQLKKVAPTRVQTIYLEAQLAYQQKNFTVANERVQQVLKATPDNVQALQLAGLVALQLNSLQQAQIHLSRAVQAAPELPLARRALVRSYQRLGQPEQALAALLPALNRSPVDPDLLSMAGEVYLQNGDVKQAEAYFTQAAQQAPQDARKRTALALTHMVSGQVEAALDELQDIAGSDPGTTADLALISAHLRRKNLDKALQAIDQLEKKQPGQPLAVYLRGRTLLGKRDAAGARKNFERALTLDSSYFPAVASLAALDLTDKKPQDAKRRFEAVLSKNPGHVQALLALAELASRTGAAPLEVAQFLDRAVAANPADVAPRVLLVDFYLSQKDLKSASSAAQNAVAALPESPQILDALGRTQQAGGDYNQAVTSYQKMAVLQPMSPLPHMRLARLYLAQNNSEAAGSSLRKGLEIKPDLIEAQRLLIVLDLNQKRYQEALARARTMQKQRPREAIGYVLEGDINMVQKEWERAATAYRSGLKQVRASELAIKLDSALRAGGKDAQADKFAADWQKDNPKDATFLFFLGDRDLARRDYASAQKRYLAVLELQANNAAAYNNLAWVSSKLKQEGAIGYAQKANELSPNKPVYMDTLALLLSEKGDYAQALALEKKALALQPSNALLQLNLAKIHIRGGAKDLARKELEKLSQLGVQFRAQAEVARLLKEL